MTSLAELVVRGRDRNPDRIALVEGEHRVSYAELVGRAAGLAHHLRDRGTRFGDQVGVCLGPGRDQVVSLLATQLLGAAYVPLDPDHPNERLSYLVRDSGIGVVVTDEVRSKDLTGAYRTVLIADVTAGDPALPAELAEAPAYMLYTSGSTGRPKGVVVPQRNVVNLLAWLQDEYRLTADDVVLRKAPFGFDVSVWETFWPLVQGARIVSCRPGGHRDPRYLAELIRAEGVTTMHFVPTMLAEFVGHQEAVDPDATRPLTSVRRLLIGGESLAPALAQTARRHIPARIDHLYGPTETTVDVSRYTVPDAELAVIPIGSAVAGARLHVLDDALRPTADGAIGELYVGGPGLAHGYHGRPGLTAERFVPDPFGGGRLYRTGDLVRRREDGNLEFHGRTDHQVKIRGNRVELGEVEAALLALPGVTQAAVVVDRERLVAFVAGAEVDLGELRTRMPGYLVPAAVLYRSALPVTSSGKVDRQALHITHTGGDGGDGGATGSTEAALLAIWRELIDDPGLTVTDDFFAAGGDSVTAMRVVTAAHRSRLWLTVQDVLDGRTVRAAARRTAPIDPAADPDTEDRRTYELTPIQAGMLFRSQEDDGAYLQQTLLRVDGVHDMARFVAAWQTAVNRHPVLRSVFRPDDDGHPTQTVLDAAPLDVRELGDADLEAVLAADRAEGFAPAERPPLRLTLLRRPDDVLVVLTYHHLLLDGWSWSTLLPEVTACYRDPRATLPAVVPYRRFVDWMSARRGTSHEYWANAMAHLSVSDDLPSDRNATGDDVLVHDLVLDPALRQELGRLGREHGVTIAAIVHAAWGLLLSRQSGRAEAVTGTTVALRPASISGAERIVGPCLSTLPLRIRVNPDTPVGPWLREVQHTLGELGAHADLTLPDIQRHSAVPAGQQLFDTLVVVENYQRPDTAYGPGSMTHLGTREYTGYPLVLALATADGAPRLELRADRRRFTDGTVTRMGNRLRHIISQLGAAESLIEVDAVPPDERPMMLDEQPAIESAGDERTLPELVAEAAERHPDAEAVRCGAETLTYADLMDRADRLARHLISLGVGREDPVGIHLDRSPDVLVAMLAVLRAGGAYVPMPTDVPASRIGLVLTASRARVVVTRAEPWSRLGVTAGVRPVLLDDQDSLSSQGSLPPAPHPDQLAYVIYTSGSTGVPKGVACQHRGVVNYLRWCLRAYLTGTGRGAALFSSYGFDLVVPTLFAPLLAGHPVHLMPAGDDLADLGRFLVSCGRLAFLKLTPGHLDLLSGQLTAEQAAGLTDTFVVGGEALLPRTTVTWAGLAPGSSIVNEYGPTEITVANCTWTVPADPGPAPLPIGRSVPGTRMLVLRDGATPVPVGMRGEICIGGVGVARGYLGQPALTAERFVPDPFAGPPGSRLYRTGDLGSLTDDGEMVYHGRNDRQVKVRGYRIELGEIETQLRTHPAVADALVTVYEERGRTALAAYCAANASTADEAELRAWLAGRLPDYMIPAAVVLLPALPLNANGKIDRAALPAPVAARPLLDDGAPRDAKERILAAVWCRVLGLDRVGVHDNFFQLGGDSILSIQAVALARREGLDLTSRQLFSNPTVAGLAVRLELTGPTVPDSSSKRPGRIPLPPIHRRFTAAGLPAPGHYNQSMVLTIDDPDPERLRRALCTLVARHDALRLRLEPDGRHATVAEPGAGEDLLWIDADPEQAQASLDLNAGPLLRAVLLSGSPAELLLIIHHVAVDNLSWRVLLDDLTASYASGADRPAAASFADRAARLAAPATLRVAEADRPYWAGVAGRRGELPVDHPSEAGLVRAADAVTVRLTREQTRDLTAAAPASYRMRVEDLLLTALARALAGQPWAAPEVIEVEWHGREPFAELPDASTMVGWFTSIQPVRMDLPTPTTMDSALTTIKDRLRSVPAGGLSYGVLCNHPDNPLTPARCGIVFNYAGRLDHRFSGVGDFRPAADTMGTERAGAQVREHDINIEGVIRDDQLELRFVYSADRLARAAVERLGTDMLTGVVALVEHCRQHPGGATPADFPGARLTQSAVDAISARHDDIEDVYPLTAAQEGLLFHSLLDPDGEAYFQQHLYRISGPLDPGTIIAAWERAVARHAALRTTVEWENVDDPVQVVHGRLGPRLSVLDWRAYSAEEQRHRLEGLLAEDISAELDLATTPPVRARLIRRGDGDHGLLLTFHHLLLDGWSVGILLAELLRPADSGVAPTFGRYVRLLRAADDRKALPHWRSHLAGYREPARLPVVTTGRTGSGVDVAALPEVLVERLREVAGRHRVTLSTLLLGVWLTQLSGYTGRSDLVVGVTAAGRPVDRLPGIESTLGMFINTIPLRREICGSQELGVWLRATQDALAACREHETTPLTDIQSVSDLDPGVALFDSIFVFENYPAVRTDATGRLRIVTDRVVESTGYPLTFVVETTGGIRLTILYDRRCFEPETVKGYLDDSVHLLETIGTSPRTALGDLLRSFAGVPNDDRSKP